MYPLTIGLAIENRDLRAQTQACLADLPFRLIVEHQDIGDLSSFLDRLERMRPDVVLVDISNWREPLEGLVSSIRGAIGDPMIIALNTTADADSILSALRAGINEYLYPPLRESLKRALERRSTERSRRREGGTKGGGKAYGFFSAKGGCGATTPWPSTPWLATPCEPAMRGSPSIWPWPAPASISPRPDKRALTPWGPW